jgi:hypothetical protein
VEQQTRELVVQAESLLGRLQETLSLYEDLLARTRTVGMEIVQRVAHVLSAAEKNQHDLDKTRLR